MTPGEIVQLICPTLGSSPNLAAYLEQAALYTSPAFFGRYYDRALALRACHMYTLDSRMGGVGGSGEISSMKEGDLAIGYHKASGASSSAGYLNQTSYGGELYQLIRMNGPAVSVQGYSPDAVANAEQGRLP